MKYKICRILTNATKYDSTFALERVLTPPPRVSTPQMGTGPERSGSGVRLHFWIRIRIWVFGKTGSRSGMFVMVYIEC